MHAMKTSSDLGRLVQLTRKQQEMTQEQLAAACGFGIRFIRELEKGKEGCHLGKALVVIDMLGLKLVAINRGDDLS